MKTLTWQLEEWTCSKYSPWSLVVKESTWIRKGTPFSPPCFLGVNSVLTQFTCGDGPTVKHNKGANVLGGGTRRYLDEDRGVLLRIPEELDGAEVQRVCVGLQNPHREREVCNDVPTSVRFCYLLILNQQSEQNHPSFLVLMKEWVCSSAPFAHLCPRFGPRVCSTSIPPAAGAPCTAAGGRGTPRARCSVDKQDRVSGRRTGTVRAERFAPRPTAGLLSAVRKGSK